MSIYNLNKTVYDKQSYENVIDTSLGKSNLIAPPPPLASTITVDEFFNLYTTIFYDIPVAGDVNSHAYIVKTSGNYVGGAAADETKPLLEEITTLKQQVLTLTQQNTNLQLSASLLR